MPCWHSSSVCQIGLQGPTVSTAVQAALVQPWQVAVAAFHVSVTAMATHSEDTVTTRQASATAPTTLRDHTVSPACLVTTATPGKQILTIYFKCDAKCVENGGNVFGWF